MDKELIFKHIRESAITEKDSLILDLCRDKVVLDVGCVGQDFSYDNPDWLHNLVRNKCKEIDGVDIDTGGINILKEKGFSVFHPDELAGLEKRYDVILMADVIEHVNDPVSFLRFYSDFLADDGIMLITTPNAHGIRHFSNILIRNNYSVNPEHTFWFCPKTLTETVQRAGLEFRDFFWLDEYYKLKDVKGFKFRFIYIINKLFQKLRSGFSPNFMYLASR